MKINTGVPAHDLRQVGLAAKAAQDNGFSGVSTQENRQDAFLPLAVAATQTDDLEIRTNIAIAFALGIALNYVGFTDFLRAPLGANTAKFTITAIITGITYSGILNTPRMYADSWASWQVYNVLKLYQNVLFGNIAYVAKYAFYLINATLAWVVWHRVRNGRDFSKKV